MRVVQHLDEALWKEFVDSNPAGNVFLTPEMFQVFSRAQGSNPILFATLDDDGRPLALLSAVQVTLLDGPARHFTTRAVAYGGLLIAPKPEGEQALATLLQAYRGERNGCLFTELRNLCDCSNLRPMLEEYGFAYEPHLNYLIDLRQDERVLWDNISKSARQRVRSGLNKGVVIEEAGEPGQQVEAAYGLLQNVYRRVQVPLASRSLFDASLDILAPKGMFKILLARLGDHYIGARFLLMYNRTIIDWYAGVDRAFSTYSPNELLVWHSLQWGKANNFHHFDFGGAGRPDEEYGPREFKAKFGGSLANYGRNICIHAPLRLKVSQIGYQLLRRCL